MASPERRRDQMFPPVEKAENIGGLSREQIRRIRGFIEMDSDAISVEDIKRKKVDLGALGRKIGGKILNLGIPMNWLEVRESLLAEYAKDDVRRQVVENIRLGITLEDKERGIVAKELREEEQRQAKKFKEWKA